MNFFTWVRDGVRQAVLMGVSDAVGDIGTPPEGDDISQRLLQALRSGQPVITEDRPPNAARARNSAARWNRFRRRPRRRSRRLHEPSERHGMTRHSRHTLRIALHFPSIRVRSCSRWSFCVSGSAAGSTGIGSPSSSVSCRAAVCRVAGWGRAKQGQPDGRVAGQRGRDLLDRVVAVLRGQGLDDPTDAELLLGVQPAEVELAEVGQRAGIAAAQGPIGRLALGKASLPNWATRAVQRARPDAPSWPASRNSFCSTPSTVSASLQFGRSISNNGSRCSRHCLGWAISNCQMPWARNICCPDPEPNASAIFSPGTWLNSTGRNDAPPRGVRRIRDAVARAGHLDRKLFFAGGPLVTERKLTVLVADVERFVALSALGGGTHVAQAGPVHGHAAGDNAAPEPVAAGDPGSAGVLGPASPLAAASSEQCRHDGDDSQRVDHVTLVVDDKFLLVKPGGVNLDIFPVGAGAEQDRANSRMGPAVVQRAVRPHDVEGRREGIGQGGRGGHDRRRQHAFGRPARSRIEDVSVAASAMPERLELPARGSQCPVVEPNDSQPPTGLPRVANADLPRLDGWGRHSCLPWAGKNACPTRLPRASTLLWPPWSRKSASPKASSRSAQRSRAYPLPMLPRLIRTPGLSEADRPPRGSSSTRWPPTRDWASASWAGEGTSPLRRANPHASQSGADVTSYAPSVSSYKRHRQAEQIEQRRRHFDGLVRPPRD